MRVAEEAGTVRLLVLRAQGYQGEVSVEWRTTDDTAKSSGKNPPDFTVSIAVSSHLSGVARKPVFGVSDQVRHKPGCTTTEDG